jgi:hypothetical protein
MISETYGIIGPNRRRLLQFFFNAIPGAACMTLARVLAFSAVAALKFRTSDGRILCFALVLQLAATSNLLRCSAA